VLANFFFLPQECTTGGEDGKDTRIKEFLKFLPHIFTVRRPLLCKN
jgi:hypothetical protein